MNINKLFSLLLLINTVAFLLAVTTEYHLPAIGVWVILPLTAAITYAAMTNENTTNQKEEEK